MSSQARKLLISMTAVSVVLLVAACGILFAVAWNSMMTVSQLRNENRTLSLMVNACSTRLENEGISPISVPQAAPAPAAEPAKSAEPGISAEPAKPAESTQSAQSAQSTQPKPSEAAKPQPEKAEAAPAAAEQKKEQGAAAPSAQTVTGSVVVEGISVPLPPEKGAKK